MGFRRQFTDPGRDLRPFRIVHDFDIGDAGFERGMEIVRARLDELQSFGFAGVTVNVPFHRYLESGEGWRWFVAMVEEAVARGLRLWLYDEKGYPSGGAGGITLRDHPAFEARGAAMLFEAAGPGQTVCLRVPRGHDGAVAAFACPGTSPEDMDTERAEAVPPDEDGAYRYLCGGGSRVVMLFAHKRSYEGTHAHHNVCARRRYINVSQKAAVDAFAANTYRPYFDRVGQYCGREIEAVFTDEPSYMSVYLNAGLEPSDTDDPVDGGIPLLPAVPWGEDVVRAFQERNGYDLVPRLPCLFGGGSAAARRVRVDYYRTLSALYEEAYFRNLADLCAGRGLAFSGHVLLEDRLYWHVLFEGDMMRLLRHMHIPGIDLITARPENAWADACTPKLASSVARFHNRPHVMSETSSHAEMADGRSTLSFAQQMCTVAMQYALGVDMIHSYFADRGWTAEENRVFCAMVGRLGLFVRDGRLDAPVAVYYPFDTMAAHVAASSRQLFEWDGGADAAEIERCWQGSMRALLDAQVDFELIGSDELVKCRADGGWLRHPCGSAYRALALPRADILTAAELDVVESFRGAGGTVILCGAGPALCATEEENARLLSLRRACANAASPEQVAAIVTTAVRPAVRTDKPCPRLVAMHRVCGGHDRYLLVNGADRPVRTGVWLSGGGEARLWNPFDGTDAPAPARPDGGGVRLALEMPPYGVLLVTVGATEPTADRQESVQ